MNARFTPLPKREGMDTPTVRIAPQQPARASWDLSYTQHYILWVHKTGKKLEEGLEHPLPLHQMNVPTDNVHMLVTKVQHLQELLKGLSLAVLLPGTPTWAWTSHSLTTKVRQNKMKVEFLGRRCRFLS